MRRNIFLIILILISIITSQLNAQQIEQLEKSPPTESIAFSVVEPTPTQDVQQSFDKEIAILQERVNTIYWLTGILIAVLAIVLSLGGLGSFVGWIRAESRTSEAHRLFITGERAAQGRSDEVHKTFLESSKNTLNLVNDTLALAKEASERAAHFIENKARLTLEELDKNAKLLIESVHKEDDRALVAAPKNRSELRSLAQKIAGFEINRFVLPINIELTSYCLFIRGLDFHLNQQFTEASKCWQSVALRVDTPNPLKSLAWYWIGYEHNNLAEFEDACISFERALETAEGARRYELKRILLESRFFNKSKESAEKLIPYFETLLNSIESEKGGEEFEENKRKILVTMGNIYYQLGNELMKSGKNEEAQKKYQNANNCFEKAGQNMWALFGFAETLYRQGKKETAHPVFEKVRSEAIAEYIRREEPRSKVLARTTELICCIQLRKSNDEITGIYSQVIDALGQVNELLTVYSQMQRRNITKTEFKKDLEELMADSRQVSG
jgi:tetratricopeptide (TPR) repeat protein